MQFEEARDLFPGLQNKVFLDAACVSLIPRTAKEKIIEFLDMALECPSPDASLHHIAMDTWRSQANGEAARLFNVDPTRIALIESTTHGLNTAANAIGFCEGDEVLIVDTEFLQVAIPFSKKEEEGKLKIVAVQTPPGGILTIESFEKKITKKTKAICVSSVQWCTGQRLPMRELGQLCRSRGIWLIVDGVHEAGALHVDLSDIDCDFYICGGHKWLNSPFGCGVMVMSRQALELSPSSFGYLALAEPDGGWGAFFRDPNQSPFRQYVFPKRAKTFEIAGTSNYPGAIGLLESLKIVNSIGSKRVEHRVTELALFLRLQLERMGIRVSSPSQQEALSGITIFQLFEDRDADLDALEKLLREKILVSIRYTSNLGGIRVSTHYFNNEDDILKLCSSIQRNCR